jgi:superfamily I DNA/RNA helicase
MAVAADVLAEIDPAAKPPASVRDSGVLPWRLGVVEAAFATAVADAAVALAASQAGEGTLAVIVPHGRLDELKTAVRTALPGALADDDDIERPVVILTVRQAKGLEFDSVLVADPGQILADSPRGLGDLYVAITRATQRLGVIHTGEIPRVLRRLEEVQPRRAAEASQPDRLKR